ncbi:MAG: hypothetical protein R6U98_18280, partial [Pirellulaceae bacterium]
MFRVVRLVGKRNFGREAPVQLGHEQLQTSMVYLDITTEQEAKALATLEDENDKRVSKKWKNDTNDFHILAILYFHSIPNIRNNGKI